MQQPIFLLFISITYRFANRSNCRGIRFLLFIFSKNKIQKLVFKFYSINVTITLDAGMSADASRSLPVLILLGAPIFKPRSWPCRRTRRLRPPVQSLFLLALSFSDATETQIIAASKISPVTFARVRCWISRGNACDALRRSGTRYGVFRRLGAIATGGSRPSAGHPHMSELELERNRWELVLWNLSIISFTSSDESRALSMGTRNLLFLYASQAATNPELCQWGLVLWNILTIYWEK
jgi:hypothetical protein